MLMSSLAFLVIGLVLLVFAGDYLVRGAVGLAEKLNISPLIIGLTIVSMGTSLPELFVSVQAAFDGVPGLAVGNVIGSNTANVLLVLGAPALIMAVKTDEDGIMPSMIIMLLASAAAFLMLLNGSITRLEGFGLLAILVGFLVLQFVRSKDAADNPEDALTALEEEVGGAPHDNWRIAIYILGGLIALPIAAHLVVLGASDIARSFGVSDAVIGLTIVAIGTSLPELATSVMAAIRGSSQVAIGNVVGSNIFNIAGILGTTAVILPLNVTPLNSDLLVMIGASLVLALFAIMKWQIGKPAGAAMLIAYAAYIYSVF